MNLYGITSVLRAKCSYSAYKLERAGVVNLGIWRSARLFLARLSLARLCFGAKPHTFLRSYKMC